jgi:oligopeptide transport system permease protein
MYYLKRLLFMFPCCWRSASSRFALLRIAPGGPFDREREPASPEIKRMLRAKYHLDDPFLLQYTRYVGDLLRGDLGPSTQYRDHSINDIVAKRIAGVAHARIARILFCAGSRDSARILHCGAARTMGRSHRELLCVLAFCIPSLVVAPVLIMIFALKLGWLPPALWQGPKHAILPMIALGLYYSGRIARLLREGMTEVLQQPFITAARAKGMSETQLLWKHAFRLGVLPWFHILARCWRKCSPVRSSSRVSSRCPAWESSS